MRYIGGSKEAVQLLAELEDGGNLICLNSADWLAKINVISDSVNNLVVNQDDLLLIHIDLMNKSAANRLAYIFPPLSSPINSKECVFLVLNLTLQRVLCIGLDDADVFFYDTLEGEYHNTLLDVDGIELFLQSDVLNQVQNLCDGLSEYTQSLCEYKSLFRYPEDEVLTALENTANQSDLSLVEIEGDSLTRGELIDYEKIISKNAVRMNEACKKIGFFFPNFDFSELNLTER